MSSVQVQQATSLDQEVEPDNATTLSRVHVTLALVSMFLVCAAVALEADRSAADEANSGVEREGVAALACEGPVELAKEGVKNDGKACDAVYCGVLEYDTAVELRCGVRVSVVRAPACEARL